MSEAGMLYVSRDPMAAKLERGAGRALAVIARTLIEAGLHDMVHDAKRRSQFGGEG